LQRAVPPHVEAFRAKAFGEPLRYFSVCPRVGNEDVWRGQATPRVRPLIWSSGYIPERDKEESLSLRLNIVCETTA